MKHKRKSSPIKPLLALIWALGLGGCSAVQWPHAFGGNEVPQSVVEAPSPIERPPPKPTDSGWLLLGNVPSRPKDFTPPAVSGQIMQQMINQREQAQKIQQQLEPADGQQPPSE